MSEKKTPEGAPAAKPDTNQDLTVLVEQIGDLRDQNRELQADRDRKDQEIQGQSKRIAELENGLHATSCMNLAIVRAVTGSVADPKLDTFSKVERYGEELRERTPASIADSLKDEAAAFTARVPAMSGLPKFIKDSAQPDTRYLKRDPENQDTADKPKDTAATPKKPIDLM